MAMKIINDSTGVSIGIAVGMLSGAMWIMGIHDRSEVNAKQIIEVKDEIRLDKKKNTDFREQVISDLSAIKAKLNIKED